MKTVGDRIRHIRNERNLTLEALADKAGISKSFLWSVENNKSDISGEYLLRVADALEASVEFILRGNGKEEAPTPAIEFPRELIQAAEKLGLSFRETRALLQAQASLLARRSSKAEEVEMTAEQWEKLWHGIKDFIRIKEEK